MNKSKEELVFRVNRRALDDLDFPLGVVRLSLDRNITFMNRAARDMIGDNFQIGDSLSSIAFDPASVERLRTEIEERFRSEGGSSYPLQLKRKESGMGVRVRVSAVPEYGEDGSMVGSLGLLVDESIEEASMAIHKAIQGTSDPAALFFALCVELQKVISFDTMLVTGISHNRHHLQRLFEGPVTEVDVLPTKWWPMPPFVKAMMDEFEAGPLNLNDLFNRADFMAYAQTDPTVRQFRERGLAYSLRIGVHHERELVATVSLMRKKNIPYTQKDYERCLPLPIAEAVNAALAMGRHRQLEFGLELINSIAEIADSIAEVSQLLVDRLAEHYGWQHVSLFRVDEDRRVLRMICQANTAQRRLSEGYEQGFAIGLIGKAHAEKKAINEGNISLLAPEEYVSGIPGTISEMVLPVPGSKMRWLLNVEASMRDAFADEEQASVELLLRVAGFILDRIATLELKEAILNSVADAVIQTNSLGWIQDANPAAEKLLGIPLAKLKHKTLLNFMGYDFDMEPSSNGKQVDHKDVLDVQAADRSSPWEMSETAVVKPSRTASEKYRSLMFSKSSEWPPTRLKLLHSDGTAVPVLISAATLPTELGGKVFVASNLTYQVQVEHMDLLNKVFRQVAGEIRIPLALASTFLGDASNASSDYLDLIDKSLKQIRKADLPLERALRLSSATDEAPLPHTIFDLVEAVNEVKSELPRQELRSVRIGATDQSVLVKGARHELMFCVRSLLAYLLRLKSQVELVDVAIGRKAVQVFLKFELRLAEEQDASDEPQTLPEDVIQDLMLTESVINGLMLRMGGSYSNLDRANQKFLLLLRSGEALN